MIHNATNCGFMFYITGDKHFLVVELATNSMWIMCPPDTHTDEYANIAGDLPENNAGVAILRIAVKGPHKGQPYVVFITPRMMQECLTTGREMDYNRGVDVSSETGFSCNSVVRPAPSASAPSPSAAMRRSPFSR